MQTKNFKAIVGTAVKAGSLLLLAAVAGFGQTINLTAQPTSLTLPDGTVVPMWGYACGTAPVTATCRALNPNAAAGTWSPVVITVPYVAGGASLTINLTNNLSFLAAVNKIPTSLVIVGQVGGGLGSSPNYVASPSHTGVNDPQANVTWPIANTGATPGVPPVQGQRVQSFATEVPATTTAPLTWSALKPGTYLLESGTHPSIQVPMGLYGVLVVTTAPAGATAGTAYPAVGTAAAVTYNAEVPLEFSEIDPVQNTSVNAAANTTGFSETMVWSGQPGQCGDSTPGNPNYHKCYPPAVNYTPFYFLINGVPFNRTNATASLFATAPATGVTGKILVRMVNAGLHMHVPSIVGSQTIGFNGGGTDASGVPATAVTGFSLIAEDGNVIPGIPRVQSDVFMSASKTFDVMVNVPASTTALPVYDRELSLSGNSSERDAGMLAYIGVNSATVPTAALAANNLAVANPDAYPSLVGGQTLTVSDASKGVMANDVNVYGVQLMAQAAHGTVTLNANGTFTYVQTVSNTSDRFTYCANGTVTAGVCSSGISATVTLGPAALGGAPVAGAISFTATTSTFLKIPSPGVLAAAKDPTNYPLTVVTTPAPVLSSGTLVMDANGGFTATVSGPGTYTFNYTAKNSEGQTSASSGLVTLTFPAASNLPVKVVDAKAYQACAGVSSCVSGLSAITDYKWIIEEDKTFYVDPNCTTNANPQPAGCPALVSGGTVPIFGVNFSTSHLEFVAQGCTGPLSCEAGQKLQGVATVCDVGNGACRPGTQKTAVLPSSVVLDPNRRYYISVLPGDAANPFETANASGGHAMTGAPIPAPCKTGLACTPTFAPVLVLSQPSPLPPGKLSVVVYEDDFPLNGEQDSGGGVGVVSPNEPGLGGFNIVLWDAMGQPGDFTGQMTYDMFNMPLSNSLAGTIDPATGLDSCPISKQATANPTQAGITGMIVTCPKYESDNKTLSPLAGQAVIANLMPGRFVVQAYPGADRIARGEQWLQTNTLDGQHPHDAFIRIGEPSYFQEYGPAGYHDSIGMANPQIINNRLTAVCAGAYGPAGACNNTIMGQVVGERMSRTPDQRLYPSGSHDALYWTQSWVSLGDPDAEDFMFTWCDANGNFKFTGVPGGTWRVTIGDQWNDVIIDGLSTPANVTGGATLNMGQIGVQQWQSNVYTRTFIDDNKDGISQATETGIPFLNTSIRYRDGSLANNLVTDLTGTANFNETFPLFNWYAVETDTTRYKTTGIHTVYDAGGPADGTTQCGPGNGAPSCGTSTAYRFLANTYEQTPLPTDLSVPGAVYCATADCAGQTGIITGTPKPSTGVASTSSTGRIDPPWVVAEGWQGFVGQNNFIEFGKAPYASCPPACATVTNPVTHTSSTVAENGGIKGHVIYASTRPFDDPQMLVQTQWEPLVPHVTINLYQEGFAADGVTPTLNLVDTTTTSSWDDWVQGFYPNSTAGSGSGLGQKPYMSCPGQFPGPSTANPSAPSDLFFFALYNQPDFLDVYNSQHNGTTLHTLPYNSQFKCYDAMHNWNQVQPAPYDGMYAFPSVLGINASGTNAGKLNTTLTGGVGTGSNFVAGNMPGSNCTICVPNPDTTDPWRSGTPMLPPGKYVAEVVMPPGYEVVKEEDKNILIGDNYIAPVTQEFAGLAGSVFIIPDQASVASLYDPSGAAYNANNAQNPTQNLGMAARSDAVPGFFEPVWPCVGESRQVPDYISLFPQSLEVAPFAGATRRLCDRKEVTLTDQAGAIAKFYIYTSTHIASKFTGLITDDFTSEFDPFAPTFGEKFAPANMPVSLRDYTGNEISRVYADHFGAYNGVNYSTWEVNPPNPTGYSPTMMVQCMNDPGPIPDPGHPGQMITDPLYNPAYSDFCYELPYMPGTTDVLDTPVVPTEAFVGAGYNNVDCAYPDATPAIKEVDSTNGIGPYVSASGTGHTLTITALGDQPVINYAYAGPSGTVAPFNAKTVNRHFGFGAQCTAPSARSTTCNTLSSVTIGGIAATIGAWNDTTITVTVPSGVAACPVQQQAQYGGSAAKCGELVITAGNGKQSVDAITVTIGGKAPTHVPASGLVQSALDAAAPGDLIIVDPTCSTSTGATTACGAISSNNVHSVAAHTEMLIMWKPVRLQGVGGASSIISANAQPAAKLLDPWRRHINCLFGLSLQGVPYTSGGASGGTTPYDPSGTYSCPDTGTGPWNYFNATPSVPQIDRLPLEATTGWDATLNGNLGELLQEPSLMGAYEGAGITVLARGVDYHGQYPWGTEAGFPAGTTLLTGVVSNPGALSGTGSLPTGDANPLCKDGSGGANRFPSNYMCNPSSIDGLGITNSSQGGGGVFVHGWSHNLQIANNRIYNNAGTLSGGITVGQGEYGPAYVVGGTLETPSSCSDGTGFVTNQHLPFCLQIHVNVHHNMIAGNSAIGDELFSSTLSGSGGVTICTGNDYYKFNYNWICGNLSAGEGGGVVHLGEIFNGDIEHNSILFNQSSNPTIPTNGGGVMVQGTPDTDPVCPGIADADCPPGLSDGTGPGLVINANLIQGNSADSGSGGGIRLQQVNGTEVSTFPHDSTKWHAVTITNNIIINNMAGWDGAGISLQDALNVNIVNNTIAHNDSLASSGVLATSIGAPSASAPAGNCVQNGPSGPTTASCPQSAGVTSTQNSALLTTTFTGLTLTCPSGHPNCQGFSNPLLFGDIFWQNRSFYIGVGNLGNGALNQQKLVSLFDAFTSTAAPLQTSTGQCTSPVSYWDIGVRGDKGTTPGVGSGFKLNPVYSVLTSTAGYTSSGTNNSPSDPAVISYYCNGSRVPPECTKADGCGGPSGFGVPPGIADSLTPNPVFSLTPSATVDEGNNWINVSWGPLSQTNPTIPGADGNYGGGSTLANYTLSSTSPAVAYIPCVSSSAPCRVNLTVTGLPASVTLPGTDFFGNPRPDPGTPTSAYKVDVGAVELQISK
jgi:hypothetical protein